MVAICSLRKHSLRLISAGVAATMLVVGYLLIRGSPERDDRCEDKLLRISAALLAYESQYGHLPPASAGTDVVPIERALSWCTQLTPFFEGGIKLDLRSDEVWDSPHNLEVRARVRISFDREQYRVVKMDKWDVFTCRQDGGIETRLGIPVASFVGNGGVGDRSLFLPAAHPRAGVFGYGRVTRLSDIRDGLGSTITIIDTTSNLGPWIAGDGSTVRSLDPAKSPILGKGAQFGGHHAGHAIAAFADGSVRPIPNRIDPRRLAAFFTICGND